MQKLDRCRPGGELPRVVVVDDQDEIRQAIMAFIEEIEGFTVVGEAASTPEAIEVVAGTLPDLVVVDLILGDGPDGIQLTRGIKANHPLMPVLMLSGRDEAVFAERALLAGTSGYLMKQSATESLVTAMNTALQGGIWLSEAMRARLLPAGLDIDTAALARLEAGGANPDAGLLRPLIAELRRGNRTVLGLARALSVPHSEVERALDRLCHLMRLPSRAALFIYLQPQQGAVETY